MVKLSSWLHLPKFSKNGKVQETQVPESLKETPLTEVEEPPQWAGNILRKALQDMPEDLQIWDVPPSQDPLFDLVRVITEVEELVVQTYARITKAQVEFKTGRDGTRYLQIYFAVDRKMNKKQLAKLRKQVIARVALRVDSQIKVVAFELKDTPQNDSNDPSS